MLRILNLTLPSLNSPSLVEHVIRATQELLGYKVINATMIYNHVNKNGGLPPNQSHLSP